jgi:hypothetical protein
MTLIVPSVILYIAWNMLDKSCCHGRLLDEYYSRGATRAQSGNAFRMFGL